MIPDYPPSQEVLESALRQFAELADSSTLNPKEIYPACIAIAENIIYQHENKENLPETSSESVYEDEGLCYTESCDEMVEEAPENPFEEEGKSDRKHVVETTEADQRPDLSYIELIKMALLESPTQRMKLVDIYAWIEANYPFFAKCGLSWKNSVRHALSISKYFTRVLDKPVWCRGGEWTLNRDELRGAELKRAQMIQAVQKMAKEESTSMFKLENMSGHRKRKAMQAQKRDTANSIKEMVASKPKVDPECLSEYHSICFGDPTYLSDLLGGVLPTQFTGIFSGTQTPLDPFCSIEESERELESKRVEDFHDYFTEEYTEGNLFDLVVAEDGMIRSRPAKQHGRRNFYMQFLLITVPILAVSTIAASHSSSSRSALQNLKNFEATVRTQEAWDKVTEQACFSRNLVALKKLFEMDAYGPSSSEYVGNASPVLLDVMLPKCAALHDIGVRVNCIEIAFFLRHNWKCLLPCYNLDWRWVRNQFVQSPLCEYWRKSGKALVQALERNEKISVEAYASGLLANTGQREFGQLLSAAHKVQGSFYWKTGRHLGLIAFIAYEVDNLASLKSLLEALPKEEYFTMWALQVALEIAIDNYDKTLERKLLRLAEFILTYERFPMNLDFSRCLSKIFTSLKMDNSAMEMLAQILLQPGKGRIGDDLLTQTATKGAIHRRISSEILGLLLYDERVKVTSPKELVEVAVEVSNIDALELITATFKLADDVYYEAIRTAFKTGKVRLVDYLVTKTSDVQMAKIFVGLLEKEHQILRDSERQVVESTSQ